MKNYSWCIAIFLLLAGSHHANACDLASGENGPFRKANFGAGAHGGERLQSDFFKGLRQAAHVVNTIRISTLFRATEDEAIRTWVQTNKDDLIRTINQSTLKWNDDKSQLFCAQVHDNEPLVIHLSRPRCQNITSTPKAGELIIHEAVHMLGVHSETIAPAIAFTLYTAWEYAGHTLDKHLHSTTAENAPLGRELHSGIWTDKEMIVWGGETRDGITATGARYDPVLDQWKSVSAINAPNRRLGHTAVWTGEKMLIWGGARPGLRSDRLGHPYNNGGNYNPHTDSWQQIPRNELVEARYLHTAIWSGQEMIIFGGARQKGVLLAEPYYTLFGNGFAFNPRSKRWRRLPMADRPSPRFDHTAIFTGENNTMLIWGGQTLNADDDIILSDTGAIYNIETNSWKPINKDGAPSARANHTAIWTGSKMIVFGGFSSNGSQSWRVNTGGIYDPATDSWQKITVNNAPKNRDMHTAAWTGSHMIIYGGRSPVAVEPEEQTSSRDGYSVIGLYDPIKNEWATPILNDVWMDRRGGKAVWTGHEMVVWGGDGFRRSGRVYYP